MAKKEDKKKSFIMYTDNREQIEMLSDEEAGRIFKALLAYVDEGKVIDKGSRLVKVVFQGFKAQIDRDKEKYEKVRALRIKASNDYWNKKKAKNEDTKETKSNQMVSNDTKWNQKESVNVNVSDSGLSKDNINNNIEKNKKKNACAKDFDLANYKQPTEAESKVLFAILKAFNDALTENGSQIAHVRMLSPSRVEALRMLLIDYTQPQIIRGFGNAARSPYLNGKTRDRRRPADFDWIVQYDNFTKIFEGGV